MSSGVVHKKVGLLVLLIIFLVAVEIFLLMDQINLFIDYLVTNKIHIIICAVLFFLGNKLPDVIEPATAKFPFWNHRKVFHSKPMLIALIVVVILLIIGIMSYPKISLLYLVSICLGYILHLVLDSGTPKGLS